MRSILFLLLSIISFNAFSQSAPKINLRSGSAVTISDARLRVQLNFYLPHTHGLTLNGGLDSLGAVFYDDSSHSIWFIDTVTSGGHIFKQVGDAQLKDSIVVNALNQYPILHNPFRANPTDTIYFFGDSYTVGNGATNGYGWTTWFAYRMGAVEANYGVSGSTVEKRSPVDWLGATNMIDRLSTVPTKTFNRKMLVFAFGLNDIGQNGANYNTTNFKADYDSVMHYCINKGWQPWEILIIPPYWIGQAGYTTYAGLSGNPAPTVQRHRDFVFATQETATKWGTLYFDIFTDQLRNDTTLISADNIHPNDAGYKFIEWDISKYIGANERILLGTKSDGIMVNPTMINLGAGYGGNTPDPSKLRVCWYCDGTPNDNFGVGIFSQNLTFYAGGASTNIQWRINNSNPLMTLNTSGLLLDQNTSSVGSAIPHYLNLGGSYNNTKFGDSVNLKLGIYQLNSGTGAGFSLASDGSTNSFEYISPWNVSHDWWVGPTKSMSLKTTGNLLLGTNTDNGKKFQVNGDMYTNGILWFGNSSALVGANQGTSTISIYDGAQYALTLGGGKTGLGINNYSPSATVDILGGGTTSSTSSLLVRNSTPSNILQLKDNGAFSLPKYGLGNFTGTGAYRLGVNSSGDLIELGTNFNGLTETNGLTKLGGTITETTTLTGSATDKRITISSYAGIGNAVLEVINNNSSFGSQFGWAFKASSVTNAPAIYGVSVSGNGVIGGSTSGAGVYGGTSTGTGTTSYASDTLGLPLYIDYRPSNTGSGNRIYNAMTILRESGGPTVSSGIGSRIAWIMAGRDGSGNPSGQYPMIAGIEVKENIIGGPTMQSQMSLIAQGDSTSRTIGLFHGSGYVKFPFYGLGNITGTAAYNLAVDNTGKIIEVSTGGSGISSVNSQTGPAITIQGVQGANVSTSGNTLSISSPFIMEYVDTLFTTVSNTTSTTQLMDAGYGFQGAESTNLTNGSVVKYEGYGTITTASSAGTPTFRFDLGTYNIQIPINALGNSQSFEYEYHVTFVLYEIGTTKKLTAEARVDITNNGGNVTRYTNHGTGFITNTGTPGFSSYVGWNQASPDNTVSSRNNLYLVLRK